MRDLGDDDVLTLAALLVFLLGCCAVAASCSTLSASHRKRGDRRGTLLVMEVGDGVHARCEAEPGRARGEVDAGGLGWPVVDAGVD